MIATLIALPVVWLFSRDQVSTGSNARNFVAAQQGASADTANAGGDPFGSNGPIFIDGPTTPPKPAVIQIVVPAVNRSASLEGGASYKRLVGVGGDTCSAPDVPFGTTITVTNRDNGHVVRCVNRAPAVLAPGLVIVLSTDQYSQIGALIDAPVPVRLTW